MLHRNISVLHKMNCANCQASHAAVAQPISEMPSYLTGSHSVYVVKSLICVFKSHGSGSMGKTI